MIYEAQNADLVPMPDPRGAYAAQVDILRAAVWRAMGEISNDGADAAYETLAAAYALSERPNARDHEASGGSLTLDDRIDGDRSPSSDLQAVIRAHGDAAHMCDAIAADIRREHTVKRGWKAGQVSDVGEAMASSVERAGDAIWAVHNALREKAEMGVQE